MKINDIAKAYTNRWVILAPQERDERGFVLLWDVLDEESELAEAKRMKKIYEDMGHKGVVMLDTSGEFNSSHSSIVAEFFRTNYNIA